MKNALDEVWVAKSHTYSQVGLALSHTFTINVKKKMESTTSCIWYWQNYCISYIYWNFLNISFLYVKIWSLFSTPEWRNKQTTRGGKKRPFLCQELILFALHTQSKKYSLKIKYSGKTGISFSSKRWRFISSDKLISLGGSVRLWQ